MAEIAFIDCETRSAYDLKKGGVHNYARHPSTKVLCLAYAFDDADVEVWWPGIGFPGRLLDHVARGGRVATHNAVFEFEIWNHVIVPHFKAWPALPADQLVCTMARSYAMGLPGSLGEAAEALGMAQQKDRKGAALIGALCVPKRDGAFDDDPEKLKELRRYCMQDVATTRELYKRTVPLPEQEQKVWLVDFAINARGAFVDGEAAERAERIAEIEKLRLDDLMGATTGGAVRTCSAVAALKEWIASRGVALGGVAKSDVLDALSRDLPGDVREALVLRQMAAKSSVAKVKSIITARGADGRCRGLLQYHGATTGRWAGRRLQIQNFPRSKMAAKQVEETLIAIKGAPSAEDAHELMVVLHDRPMEALSQCLRGIVCAPPNAALVAADWSNIEGRVTAWISGEEWKVQAFRDFDAGTGPDSYKLAYSRSFDVPIESVTGEQRQVGKVQELSLGYEGGVGALLRMAASYNVVVSEADARSWRDAWRAAHPNVVKTWRQLEGACRQAVQNPGKAFAANKHVAYKVSGSFLLCRLPSQRVLFYPYPRIEEIETSWGETKSSVACLKKSGASWGRTGLYGGFLMENVVQAASRDLLRDALLACADEGVPVVFHVHDEIVAEAPLGDAERTRAKLLSIMKRQPAWAPDLPIAAAGWAGRTYRK